MIRWAAPLSLAALAPFLGEASDLECQPKMVRVVASQSVLVTREGCSSPCEVLVLVVDNLCNQELRPEFRVEAFGPRGELIQSGHSRIAQGNTIAVGRGLAELSLPFPAEPDAVAYRVETIDTLPQQSINASTAGGDDR